MSYSDRVLFSTFFSFLAKIEVTQCEFLIFHGFSVFLAIFQFLQCVCFSFCMFFRVSRHISYPTMWVSHFFVCQFSSHILGPTMWVSPFLCWSLFSTYSRSYNVHYSFSGFSVLISIFQVIHCLWLLFHAFSVFLPYFMSYHVCFSFSSFVSFLAMFLVIQCAFLNFHHFQGF